MNWQLTKLLEARKIHYIIEYYDNLCPFNILKNTLAFLKKKLNDAVSFLIRKRVWILEI